MTILVDETHRRIRIEQTDALFSSVVVSVSGGAVAAMFLASTLYRLGATDVRTGVIWSGWILCCALAHILLCFAYRRRRQQASWRIWAGGYTAISLAEGLGWGAAPIVLASGTHADAKHLVILIMGGVAAGSIPGFSLYLPAFFSLLLSYCAHSVGGQLLLP